MATYYFDNNATTNGDGLTSSTPFNVQINTGSVDGLAFGSHTWFLAAGATWNMGTSQGTVGNNCSLIKYGTGANPVIIGSNASGTLNSATANNLVVTNVDFTKVGAITGSGINAQLMGAAPSTLGATITGSTFTGFIAGILADRSDNVTITGCTFIGGSGTFGIRAYALSGGDITNMRIIGNTFYTAAGLDLWVSDTSDTAGKFTGLVIDNNRFINQTASPILMRCGANSISTTATTSVSGASVLTRNSAWPVAWAAGKKIFLGGFTSPTNYGEFTVVSVVGTALTVTEPTAVEGAATGKGIYLMNPNQAFISPQIINNFIQGAAQTPMLVDNFIGGVISGNTIVDCSGTSVVAAAIEMLAFKNVVIENNIIRNMRTTGTVDAMGIFTDGGCTDCIVRGNIVSDLVGTPQDNSGAGYAIFYASNNQYYGNIAVNCKRGFWAGGTAGGGNTFNNNLILHSDIGIKVNSSPPVGAYTFVNNIISECSIGITDQASSVVSKNSWWKNTVDNSAGALSAIDATAITADPKINSDGTVLAGSPLIHVGTHTEYKRDYAGNQYYNPPTIGAHEYISPRGARV